VAGSPEWGCGTTHGVIMCTYINIIYKHIYIHKHIYISIYVNMYVCIWVCVSSNIYICQFVAGSPEWGYGTSHGETLCIYVYISI